MEDKIREKIWKVQADNPFIYNTDIDVIIWKEAQKEERLQNYKEFSKIIKQLELTDKQYKKCNILVIGNNKGGQIENGR